ncbi:hypothetical protein ABUL04_09675 [Micromonospora harpali]|uniref:Uncharacterized protein n=1 Tax=Micromonospora harpali TaxID=1490225 RepID=A0ABW1HLS4_9ACTN
MSLFAPVAGLGRGMSYLHPRQKAKVLVISDAVSVVFGGLVPGFLLGLLAFRVKSRWCPRCGEFTLATPPERDR